MAVLIQRFTVVVVAWEVARTFPALEEVAREMDGLSWCTDGQLLAVHYLDRNGFRRGLERLVARGIGAAQEILAATEVDPKRVVLREEYPPRLARLAATRTVALLTPARKEVNDWLVLLAGPTPGGGPVVAGCMLREDGEPGLALPRDWTPEHSIPIDEDFEPGDELLPTWREYLDRLRPDLREWALSRGPDGTLAFLSIGGDYKPFAGVVRESPYVHQEKRVVRDPDGTEHVVTDRWVKL